LTKVKREGRKQGGKAEGREAGERRDGWKEGEKKWCVCVCGVWCRGITALLLPYVCTFSALWFHAGGGFQACNAVAVQRAP